jgi:superfamily II DNA/RNA helicase
VSTIDRMQHRRDGQKLFLSNLETLVIDEFDTFVDSGMEAPIRKLLEQYLNNGPRQVIFASATVTK